MEASITLKAIGKTFRDNILLADLSFGVEKGSTFVILGENGAGKSVVLKLLVGLIEKDVGMAYIHGKDISTRGDEIRSITGYMPQTIDLDDELTVLENLEIFGRLHNLSASDSHNSALNWAEQLNFENNLYRMPGDLSYGNKRLVQFARALVHDPEVIILDEPTKGLDPHSRAKVWDILDKLHLHKTILFASQNFAEAERYADRIAILHDGNIKMDGTLERLIETTHGLTRYRLSFSNPPTEDFMEKLKEFPRILRPQVKGVELEFYSRERKQFFNALELALKEELVDMDTSICRLQDLFVGLTDGGLE
jgi:ABC-type multidrug transport system ATPase subunit